MKTKIIIGILLLSILFLSGCEFLDRTICFEHNNINMTRIDQRTWEVSEGIFKMHIYLCESNETNITKG